jgi:hypothetical protein
MNLLRVFQFSLVRNLLWRNNLKGYCESHCQSQTVTFWWFFLRISLKKFLDWNSRTRENGRVTSSVKPDGGKGVSGANAPPTPFPPFRMTYPLTIRFSSLSIEFSFQMQETFWEKFTKKRLGNAATQFEEFETEQTLCFIGTAQLFNHDRFTIGKPISRGFQWIVLCSEEVLEQTSNAITLLKALKLLNVSPALVWVDSSFSVESIWCTSSLISPTTNDG